MTYEEALAIALEQADGCAAIATELDGGLSHADEPVISMIEVTDFELLAELIRALVRGPGGAGRR